MPSYTVILGGLKHNKVLYGHGDTVELDVDEAKAINKKHQVVRLTKAIEAEADAKKKGAKAAKEAEEQALKDAEEEAAMLAEIEAEEEEKAKKAKEKAEKEKAEKAKAEADAKKKGAQS